MNPHTAFIHLLISLLLAACVQCFSSIQTHTAFSKSTLINPSNERSHIHLVTSKFDRKQHQSPLHQFKQSHVLFRRWAKDVKTNSDDEDDGWGTEVQNKANEPANAKETEGLMYKRQQQRELEALRNEASDKASSTNMASPSSSDEPERDAFIPIFALISLMGLFGSYGFEMLRLYNKGELYLPWNS